MNVLPRLPRLAHAAIRLGLLALAVAGFGLQTARAVGVWVSAPTTGTVGVPITYAYGSETSGLNIALRTNTVPSSNSWTITAVSGVHTLTGSITFAAPGTYYVDVGGPFSPFNTLESSEEPGSLVTVVISAATTPITAVSFNNLTYNGSSQTTTVSSVTPAGATYSVSGVTQTNAGSYTGTVTGTGSYSGSATASWTMNKATAAVPSISPPSQTITAGGNATITASGGSTGSFQWTGAGSGTGSSDTINFPTAGSYNVYVFDPGNANYNASGLSAASVVTVNPATTPLSSVTFQSLTYNGGSQTTSVTGVSPGGATYTNGGGTWTATNVGTYSATIAGTGSYSGTASNNWTISAEPTSFALSATSFVYNGSAQGPSIVPTPGGATYISGGTLSATAPGTYTATASANGNYTGTNNSLSWTISKSPQPGVNVTSPAATTYGSGYTATASGGAGTGAYVWTLVGGTAPGAAINSATGVVTTTGLGTVIFNVYRAADGNYLQSATSANFTLTVNAISTTFALSSTAFTYNGAVQGPSIVPTPGGATFSSGGSLSATAAGSYTATASATGVYSGTNNSLNWTIAKSGQPAVTITSANSTVYNAGYTATAVGGSGTGALVWTYVGGTAAGGGINSGTGVVSAASTGTVIFNVYRAADANFNQSATSANFTLTVTPAALTAFTLNTSSFTYDGTGKTVSVASTTPAGATYSSSGSWSATNSGTYTATITGNGNYSGSVSQSWTIGLGTQSAVTITSANSYTYGTGYTATASGGSGTGALVWTFVGGTAPGAGINPATGNVSATGPGTVIFNVYRAADSNYSQSATTANFTVTVNPITTTFTLSSTSFVYNGSAQGPTIGATPVAATFTSGGTLTATNVGSYTATAAATGNYGGTNNSLNWSITPATPVVSISAPTLTVTAGGSITFTASGGPNGYNWGGTSGATGGGTTQTLAFPSAGVFTVTAQSPAGGNYAASNTCTVMVTVNSVGNLTITGNSNFGTIQAFSGSPLSSSQTFTLTNSGGTDIVVSAASASGDYTVVAVNSGAVAFPFIVPANGGTATVSVTFVATATGTRAGTLFITNTSGNNPSAAVPLSGLADAGVLSPSWSSPY